ncbi:hypothetical protein BJX62DRAFT_233755 [Aspergillus germanicus]
MPRPTIASIPGAFHTPEYYNPVRTLEAKGYVTEAVSLLSVGGSTSSMADDATAIRASANDLGRKFYQEARKPGGIIALVYLAGYFVKKGMTDSLIFHDRTAALETFYNDFTSETDPERWTARLQTQSAASWAGELSYESYRDIPTTHLLCTRDQAIPIDIQRKFVDFAEGHISTVTCQAGHSPMVSMPEVVVDVIIGAAEASQGEE